MRSTEETHNQPSPHSKHETELSQPGSSIRELGENYSHGQRRQKPKKKKRKAAKPALKSTAIWGGLVAIAAGILPAVGYHLTQDDMQKLTTYAGEAAAIVGGIVAIIGRVKATKPIRGFVYVKPKK